MNRIIMTSVIMLCSSLLISQNTHKISLGLPDKSSTYPMVDDAKKEIILMTTAKDYIQFHKLNIAFKVIDSVETDLPKEEFKSIAGHSISENNFKVFWTTADEKKVFSKSIDFRTKKSIGETNILSLEKEYVIKKITVNNVFYMISIVKNTSLLKFYIFPADSKFTTKTIDCSDLKFYGKDSEEKNLYKVLTGSTFEPFLDIETISRETPASLILASKKRKIYLNNDNIIFTFDINPTITQLLKIDLSDFSVKQETISQPELAKTNDFSPESNSYLIGDRLLQIKLNSQKIILALTGPDGVKIKQHEVTNDSNATFVNTEIIQENGNPHDVKILDKSSQLVRKMNNPNPAVTCYKKGDNFITTIGSVGAVQANSAAMYGGMFGVAGALLAQALMPNPNLNNLNSYKDRKVIYSSGLFDKDFNHMDGQVQKSGFDTARTYTAKITKQTNLTMFNFNSVLYIGSYAINQNTYTFQGFTD